MDEIKELEEKLGRFAMEPGSDLIKFFKFSHLPLDLRAYSWPFASMVAELCSRVPSSPERTAGLRKLLEAKDCFVRAAL